VVTESVFLVLEPDHKIKNVARLVAWANLAALEQIKRNVEAKSNVQFIWRQLEEKEQWILSVVLYNVNECITLLSSHLNRLGLTVKKVFEKKKKIMESEVTKTAMKEVQIDPVISRIDIL
jgi:hypothetical protein